MNQNAKIEDVLKAIRAHCLDCCAGSRNLVERCMSEDCHLHPYRTVDSAQKVHTDMREEIEGQLSMFEEERNARLSKGI